MIDQRTILFLFLLLLVIFYNIYKLYSNATIIRCDNSLDNSIVYKFKINLPDKDVINQLLTNIELNGIKLNSKMNMNAANGLKFNYQQLEKYCPAIIDYVMKSELINFCSIIVKKQLYMLANDRYQMFARLYKNKTDFIDWHYDNNFSSGLRYTLIIPLHVDECNTSELMVINQKTCLKHNIILSTGEAVLFDGSNVCHHITQQNEGCKRLTLIIPLYENPKLNLYGKTMTFIRNIGFDIFKL